MNKPSDHVVLTSHPSKDQKTVPIHWGAKSAQERGPIIASPSNKSERNAIGCHAGALSIYRALAVASGTLDPAHRPDLTRTDPVIGIGPFDTWADERIVSLDPFGHLVQAEFEELIQRGVDIRPSIAVTKARINLPEIAQAVSAERLQVDGKILLEDHSVEVTKAAIEPVWYLPGLARRFACKESQLRKILFESTGGMFPELVTRSDLKVFLPPIGGLTIYIFGDAQIIAKPDAPLSVRVHDECNGSDVFGSDICTCRPYLVHGVEYGIKAAQEGGVGVIVYNRKEGRGLGEVTKFLVYNARKRQRGGDRADTYFERTECVAGVQDVRFQDLMPDALLWLGITKINHFVSMSDMKFNALARAGIEVSERVSIPEELIPKDAQVEMVAKKASGYFSDTPVSSRDLKKTKGRKFDE